MVQHQEHQNFFLTGVNVNAKEKANVEYAHIDEGVDRSVTPISVAEDAEIASRIDQYKLISVVDAARTFSANECVFVSQRKNQISHQSVNM